MKSLSNLKFGANEVLETNQMKSIIGGAESCTVTDYDISCDDGTHFVMTGCVEHAQAWAQLAVDFCS